LAELTVDVADILKVLVKLSVSFCVGLETKYVFQIQVAPGIEAVHIDEEYVATAKLPPIT
jgi:hypothetical protein